MNLFISGSSFNAEDRTFTDKLARFFAARNYGEGLEEIVLDIDVDNISDYSGRLARSPVLANGRFEYQYTITISSYYDVVSPADYVKEVFTGLERLEYLLPQGIDFNAELFLADAKQFITEY